MNTVGDAGSPAQEPRKDPGVLYGQLMGQIWLVFLLFPVWGVLEAPRPWWVKVVGVAIIVAFGVTYSLTFRSCATARVAGGAIDNRAATAVVILGALAVAEVPIIGMSAMGLLTWIVALSMFVLPVWWASGIAVAINGLVLALPLLTGRTQYLFYAIITISVTAATASSRWMMQHAAAYEAVQHELTVVGERERVARDVHDLLGHTMTAISVKAELAERLIDLDPARAKAEVAEIHQLSRQSIQEVRATVSGLRTRSLDAELEVARETLTDAGISVTLPSDTDAVEVNDRLLLAWVLREAVTNVVRHSGARTCTVRLGRRSLSVTDDGGGVRGAAEGNGLHGLRERVNEVGGTLVVDEGPKGRGTVVEVTL